MLERSCACSAFDQGYVVKGEEALGDDSLARRDHIGNKQQDRKLLQGSGTTHGLGVQSMSEVPK